MQIQKKNKKKPAAHIYVDPNIEIKNLTQRKALDNWNDNKNLFLHGVAGSGKTFLALYLALEYAEKQKDFYNVTLVRSIVPTRDIGFLPGTMREKVEIYESPYYSILSDICGRGDTYRIMREKGNIDFVTTSFLRGETFNNTVVVVDEIQNMSFQEQDTVLTRVGNNCRVILCGDTAQDDLTSKRYNEESGIARFSSIIRNMKEFEFIEFGIDDIVRSDLVKSYIIAKENLRKWQIRQ